MTTDDRVAHDLATEAGQRLVDLRHRAGFGDVAALRAAGDRLSHEYLTAALGRVRHGDAVLSEEGADNPERLSASRVWIVDPLDGTREFGEVGRVDWAVHVALWCAQPETGAPGIPADAPRDGARGWLAAGAVALPAQGRTYSTLSAQAARRGIPAADPASGRTVAAEGGAAVTGDGRLRIAVSRSRPPEFVRRLAAAIDADLVPIGSAGAKIVSVIAGAADAYVHAGGQYEWDSAAPVAVARTAGLHACRLDGSPLEYNRPDPMLPDILVCRPALASLLLAALCTARAAEGTAAVEGTAAAEGSGARPPSQRHRRGIGQRDDD